MSHVKLHKVSQLGLQRQQENINTYSANRLGIAKNQLEYNDSFNSIDPKKLKLLINHLSDPGYFKLNKFDSNDYIDQIDFKNYQNLKELEAASIRKDNTSIAQNRISFEPKKTKEQLEQELEEWNYLFLSKSLSLNNTVAFIDNNVSRNGYSINIDYANKIIRYSYSIYYKASDELIKRDGDKIVTQKEYIAIIVKSDSIETLLFFLEKVYGKSAANFIRHAVYDKLKKELENTTDVNTLVFLYDKLPNYIKLGYDDIEQIEEKPYKLVDDLLWKHLKLFIDYDNGSNDASFYVVYVMSLISPKFLMQEFLKDQSLVVKIYNGLDDQSGLNKFFGLYSYSKTFNLGNITFEPTNKDVFVSLLNAYIQLYENDPEVAVFEPSGAHFHQGTKIGGKYEPEIIFKLDSNLVFSDDKKDKVLINNYWEGKQYLGQYFNQQGGVSEEYIYGSGYNESGYYNPLDVVKFSQYNDNGEAITLNVPAIYVKYASDIKEWEKVNEGIRVGVNILVIIASIATIYSGASSVFLIAAIADLGLASTDIIIQSEKDNLKRSEKGKEFLESWEKIYIVGGVVTFSPVAIKAVAIYAPKIVTSGAELLQVTRKMITNPEVYKKVKDLTTKAIHCLEIPNFNKTGLEILKKGFTNFPELKNPIKLQELGVVFAKGGENTMAIIYKGVSLMAGKVDEIVEKLQTALNKLKGKPLEKYFDELLEVALDNIKGIGRYGGKILSQADLDVWAKNLLKKYGTKLEKVDDFNNPEILAQFDSNSNTIRYKDDVTEYIMAHESFHAEEMNKLGFAKYNEGAALKGVKKADYTTENWLNLYRKEKYVYDKLIENAKKYNLNSQELATPPFGHAFRYFDYEVVLQLESRNIPIPKK
jgi:hypothetical protein